MPGSPGTSQNRPGIIVPVCNFLHAASGEFVNCIQEQGGGNVPEKCSGTVFWSALVRELRTQNREAGSAPRWRIKAVGQGKCHLGKDNKKRSHLVIGESALLIADYFDRVGSLKISR